MYVCGPTVYDAPHLGHGRQMLVYDVLRRYLEWSGYEVNHVSNVTDVDDNIIKRANEERRSPDEVAEEYEAAWWAALDGLGVLRPTADPHASVSQRFVIRPPWAPVGFVLPVQAGAKVIWGLIEKHQVLHGYSPSLCKPLRARTCGQ